MNANLEGWIGKSVLASSDFVVHPQVTLLPGDLEETKGLSRIATINAHRDQVENHDGLDEKVLEGNVDPGRGEGA